MERPNAKKLDERHEGPFEVIKSEGTTVTIKYYGSPKKFHCSRLKLSRIAPRIFEKPDPKEYKAVKPPRNIKADDLIGRRVRVWWPTLKRWYDGTVIARKGQRHVVRYDDRSDNTPEDEEEDYFERLTARKNKAKWKLLVKKGGLKGGKNVS